MSRTFIVGVFALCLMPMSVQAGNPKPAQVKLNPTSVPGMKVLPGFAATMFAGPPNVNYPTCVSATPDGVVFVGCDLNAAQENKPDRGRIVRCVDKNGDGVADEFTVYAKLDSPRGLIAEGNALYVLHPPKLTVHWDTDGDGVADKEETLIDGIGVDLKTRSQDHSINNIRLGIDGYIYIACGDYGFAKATSKEGVTLQKHSGGVVRIRTDGTGFEIVSNGQRNIYDVAIDPLLQMFTRDNTNDGGGWDTRLSHVVPFGEYGYPSLYKNFNEEIIQPLKDYGGGAPTGALYIDEGSLPAPFNRALYTVEWGHGAIYRHPLEPSGASFTIQQEKILEIPRPIDFDIDGAGRMYAVSWKDGMYRYERPDVGYVARLTVQDTNAAKVPDIAKTPPADLVKLIGGKSHVLRLAAQRELLRRKDAPEAIAESLKQIVAKPGDLNIRVAALFTFAQLVGAKSEADLATWAKAPELREYALEALGDRRKEWPAITTDVLVKSLTDPSPRVRLKAVIALGRLKLTTAAPAMIPLVADAEPFVAHVTRNALASMKAVPALLTACDSAPAPVLAGCLKALQQLHDPAVVDGLSQRFTSTTDVAKKKLYFSALARLCQREGDWNGSWWGVRPDNTGPYFKKANWEKSTQIQKTLADAFATSEGELRGAYAKECQRNRIELAGVSTEVLRMAQDNPTFKGDVVEFVSGLSTLNEDTVKMMIGVVQDTKQPAKTREALLQKLIESNDPAAKKASFQAVAAIGLTNNEGSLPRIRHAFLSTSAVPSQMRTLVERAERGPPPERELAYAALLKIQEDPKTPSDLKANATRVIGGAWSRSETAAGMLRAIGATNSERFADQVRQRRKDNNEQVRKAAEFAAGELRLDEPQNKVLIGSLKYEEVLAQVEKTPGNAGLGAKLFVRQGCSNCHTTTPGETPKGPFLGGISTKYKRPELCESILKPSAKIAQGYETHILSLADGRLFSGFVTKVSGDEIEMRGENGLPVKINKNDVEQQKKSELSIMPTGLGDKLSVTELAAIVAYLESLPAK